MKSFVHSVLLIPVFIVAALLSSANLSITVGTQPAWQLTLIKTIDGFDVPECTLYDPATDAVYVSNIETKNAGYWVYDNKGFISKLDPNGQIINLRWQSGDKEKLSAPKGMCVFKGNLYVADIGKLWIFSPDKPPQVINVPDANNLNDVAEDGKTVYISDTIAAKIYRMLDPEDPNKGFMVTNAPASINGLSFSKGRMFGVSWKLHEIYELDADGKNEPKPFGLAEHFTTLDGIEVLDDGTFIVSDFNGNKISAVSPDRKTVTTLATLKSPADIGIDRKRNVLYAPQFLTNQVAIFKIENR